MSESGLHNARIRTLEQARADRAANKEGMTPMKSARMPGETYEPMPESLPPASVLRRRRRVLLAWCVLAAVAMLAGGFYGAPRLLVTWLSSQGVTP